MKRRIVLSALMAVALGGCGKPTPKPVPPMPVNVSDIPGNTSRMVEWVNCDEKPNDPACLPYSIVKPKELSIRNYVITNNECIDLQTGGPCIVPHDYIAELRVEAHKQKITWDIYCPGHSDVHPLSVEGVYKFYGTAEPTEVSERITGLYSATWGAGGETQQEVAKKLLEEIRTHPVNAKDICPRLSGN